MVPGWKLECEFILDGELAEIAESRKVNTLIQWAGPFGLKNLKVWQKDKTQLSLAFIWKEFETYCKPHLNELWARYELFKQLCQRNMPCDDWYTMVQNQLTMCNYESDMESVLQRDIFLFGLNDQAFISKIISVINLIFTCLINYILFDCNDVERKLRWSLKEFNLS